MDLSVGTSPEHRPDVRLYGLLDAARTDGREEIEDEERRPENDEHKEHQSEHSRRFALAPTNLGRERLLPGISAMMQ